MSWKYSLDESRCDVVRKVFRHPLCFIGHFLKGTQDSYFFTRESSDFILVMNRMHFVLKLQPRWINMLSGMKSSPTSLLFTGYYAERYTRCLLFYERIFWLYFSKEQNACCLENPTYDAPRRDVVRNVFRHPLNVV